MRFTLLLILTNFITFSAFSQSTSTPSGCAYDHYVHHLEELHPGFQKTLEPIYQRVRAQDFAKTNQLYTIPVVVHIVYQNEDQNISDQVIDNVIASINADFRRLNTDADQVRAEFADIVGDPLIEFELQGVERVSSEAKFELDLLGGGLPDNVKVSADGGSDAWDNDSYLNIWVCNIEGGSLLGYAYPPANLENWPEGANAPSPELDGVVVHYEVFRTTGTHTASGLFGLGEVTVPIRGRTITHEIGHYLGLRHIWGDGLLAILGIPDCSVDDGIDDTPNQGINSQFNCDPEQNSCTDAGSDLPDMWENYMDYAKEDCMNSFTQQQIAVMRSVLENERSGLILTTSTEEPQAAAGHFQIFPNPSRGNLYIEAIQASNTEWRAQIFDMQGRLLDTYISLNNSTIVANTSALSPGVYGVRIFQDGKQFIERIVVQ